MTQINNVQVECSCGNKIDFEFYDSVNITVDPELILKVRNKEINSYKCRKCGRKSGLLHQFLFVDLERKIWVWCYPESFRGEESEMKKEFVQGPVGDLLLGIVAPMPSFAFGYDELLNILSRKEDKENRIENIFKITQHLENDSKQCCKNPLCRDCLTVNCKKVDCDIHKKEDKIESRVLRGILFGERLGYEPSTEEKDLVEKLKLKYYKGDVDIRISGEEKELVNKWIDQLNNKYSL